MTATEEKSPPFPKMKWREGEYDTAVDVYDCDDADPYIDWQRQEIERLRQLTSCVHYYEKDVGGINGIQLWRCRHCLETRETNIRGWMPG